MTLTDAEIRKALKYWANDGGIDRYPVPVISDRLKGLICMLIYGFAAGFVGGFVLGRMI